MADAPSGIEQAWNQAVNEATERFKAGEPTGADRALMGSIRVVKWQVANARVERASADLALVLLQRIVHQTRGVLSDQLKADIARIMDILESLGKAAIVTAGMQGDLDVMCGVAESLAAGADIYRDAMHAAMEREGKAEDGEGTGDQGRLH